MKYLLSVIMLISIMGCSYTISHTIPERNEVYTLDLSEYQSTMLITPSSTPAREYAMIGQVTAVYEPEIRTHGLETKIQPCNPRIMRKVIDRLIESAFVMSANGIINFNYKLTYPDIHKPDFYRIEVSGWAVKLDKKLQSTEVVEYETMPLSPEKPYKPTKYVPRPIPKRNQITTPKDTIKPVIEAYPSNLPKTEVFERKE